MIFLQNTKVGQMAIAPPQEDACDGREEAREGGEEAGGISGEEERWDELPPGIILFVSVLFFLLFLLLLKMAYSWGLLEPVRVHHLLRDLSSPI